MALPQLLTEKGYYCKSMDKDGTKHGVYGAEKYGYFETSPNIEHGLRELTEIKKKAIIELYDSSARALWKGLAK